MSEYLTKLQLTLNTRNCKKKSGLSCLENDCHNNQVLVHFFQVPI